MSEKTELDENLTDITASEEAKSVSVSGKSDDPTVKSFEAMSAAINDTFFMEVDELTAQLKEKSQKLGDNPKSSSRSHDKSEKKLTQAAKRKYIIGIPTAALSLIVMGIAMIVAMFTSGGIVGALKISPIILVFLGLELIANIILHHSLKLRLDLRGFFLPLALIAVTFLLSLISVLVSDSNLTRTLTESRLENEMSIWIGEELDSADEENAFENIKSIDSDIKLYSTDVASYSSIKNIEPTDSITLTVHFRKASESVIAFGNECRNILDVISKQNYTFDSINFLVDDNGNRLNVSVNGRYQLDLSAAEIAAITTYFAENLDEDIPDIE